MPLYLHLHNNTIQYCNAEMTEKKIFYNICLATMYILQAITLLELAASWHDLIWMSTSTSKTNHIRNEHYHECYMLYTCM